MEYVDGRLYVRRGQRRTQPQLIVGLQFGTRKVIHPDGGRYHRTSVSYLPTPVSVPMTTRTVAPIITVIPSDIAP